MSLNRARAAIGVAKETGDPVAVATNPAYWHGVAPGSAMPRPEVEDVMSDISTGLGTPALAIREGVTLPTGFTTLSFAKAVGVYLLGVFGDVTTTGEGAVKTHVFEYADDTPYLTFFGNLAGWLQKNGHSKIDELRFEWDGPKPLRMTVTAQGCDFDLPAEITVPDPNEILGEFFTPVGGVFKGSVLTDTPVNWEVLGGAIILTRNNEATPYSGSLTPSSIHPMSFTPSVDLTVRESDWDNLRSLITGAADGTTLSAVPVYGSVEVGFVNGDTDELTFAAGRAQYAVTFPDSADPNTGGPVDLALTARVMHTGDDDVSPITATLKNGVTAY